VTTAAYFVRHSVAQSATRCVRSAPCSLLPSSLSDGTPAPHPFISSNEKRAFTLQCNSCLCTASSCRASNSFVSCSGICLLVFHESQPAGGLWPQTISIGASSISVHMLRLQDKFPGIFILSSLVTSLRPGYWSFLQIKRIAMHQ
jgi:hypothetical protein